MANPSSSSRRARRRCATRSAAGKPSASPTRTHHEKTRFPRTPSRTRSAPCSPTSQNPNSPPYEANPVVLQEVDAVPAHQVGKQAQRHLLGPSHPIAGGGASLAPERNDCPGAPSCLKPRNRPCVGEAEDRNREGQRLDQQESDTRRREQHDDPRRPNRPSPAVPPVACPPLLAPYPNQDFRLRAARRLRRLAP